MDQAAATINISIFKDGSQFCAVFTDTFTNLQESEAGFGDTEADAVANLLHPMPQDRHNQWLFQTLPIFYPSYLTGRSDHGKL